MAFRFWFVPLQPPPPPIFTALGAQSFQQNQAFQAQLLSQPSTFVTQAPDPPPLPHGGLVAGPLVAWRAWKVEVPGEWQLRAIGVSWIWPPGQSARGACNAGHLLRVGEVNAVPWRGCGCGLWGMRKREDLDRVVEQYGASLVVGRVALWGRVIEHEQGYRAEWGYPVELWVPWLVPPMPGFPRIHALTTLPERLQALYGVPVHVGNPPNDHP